MGSHNKTFGIGWTDNVTARMTIHHNWIPDTNQRNPSVDNVLYAHLYNNYLQNITSYGNYRRGATKMVLENSYFENVNNPLTRRHRAGRCSSRAAASWSTAPASRSTGGTAFTPSSFYSYTLDPAANVPSIVKPYAGPQAGITY